MTFQLSLFILYILKVLRIKFMKLVQIGAVNFNILQKVLVEMLRLTDLETATIQLSPSEAAKIEVSLG